MFHPFKELIGSNGFIAIPFISVTGISSANLRFTDDLTGLNYYAKAEKIVWLIFISYRPLHLLQGRNLLHLNLLTSFKI